MSTVTLDQEIFSLSVAERVALADRLYASVPDDWQKEADHAWLEEAHRRSAEIDADPTLELSYDEFVSGVKLSKSLK